MMSKIIINKEIPGENSIFYMPSIIMVFSLGLSTLIVLFNIKDFSILKSIYFILFIIFLLTLILMPYWFLYNNHRKFSFGKGIILNVDNESELTIQLNSKLYYFKDVSKVHYVKDFSLALSFYSDFNYLNVFFTDGSNLIISSIMFSDLIAILKLFDGSPIKAINRSPCFINLDKDTNAKNIALNIPEIKFNLPNSRLD